MKYVIQLLRYDIEVTEENVSIINELLKNTNSDSLIKKYKIEIDYLKDNIVELRKAIDILNNN